MRLSQIAAGYIVTIGGRARGDVESQSSRWGDGDLRQSCLSVSACCVLALLPILMLDMLRTGGIEIDQESSS